MFISPHSEFISGRVRKVCLHRLTTCLLEDGRVPVTSFCRPALSYSVRTCELLHANDFQAFPQSTASHWVLHCWASNHNLLHKLKAIYDFKQDGNKGAGHLLGEIENDELSLSTDLYKSCYCNEKMALFVKHLTQKMSDMFLDPSSMCAEWFLDGFCLHQAGLQGGLCLYAFPSRALCGYCGYHAFWTHYNWVLCFHPGFCRPAQSSDYCCAADGLGRPGVRRVVKWMSFHSHGAHWLHILCLQLSEMPGCLTEGTRHTPGCLISSSQSEISKFTWKDTR